MKIKDLLFIAHRGESEDAPENTLAAVNLAWQRNADAVEVDMHLTEDGKIVVIHDGRPWKTAGTLKKVKNQTLEELKDLDVGAYKGEQWIGEKIPTLAEVLQTVPKGKYLFVEIKSGVEILPEFISVIEKSRLNPKQVTPIGFDMEVMSAVKASLTHHDIFLVSKFYKCEGTDVWIPDLDELVDQMIKAKLDGLSASPGKSINQTFVEKVKRAGLKLSIWTVNDPIEAKRLYLMDVDAITTDRQYRLKIELKELLKND